MIEKLFRDMIGVNEMDTTTFESELARIATLDLSNSKQQVSLELLMPSLRGETKWSGGPRTRRISGQSAGEQGQCS
jgi:hypothetical protein